jgi:hypothetical protein
MLRILNFLGRWLLASMSLTALAIMFGFGGIGIWAYVMEGGLPVEAGARVISTIKTVYAWFVASPYHLWPVAVIFGITGIFFLSDLPPFNKLFDKPEK